MTSAKKNLTWGYEAAQQRSKVHIKRRPYLLPIAGLILGGVITAAVLKLFPRPRTTATAWAAVPSPQAD